MGPKIECDVPMMSKRALNRALLARQWLLARQPRPALEAIEQLAGMQSQAPSPPYVGLWTRLEGFRPDELSALIIERKAVRLALMRSTIHLVSSADALAWRGVLQPAFDRWFEASHGKFLDGVDRGELVAHGRELLSAEPCSLNALGTELAKRWPGRDARALAQAIRAGAALVQVPPRGLWRQSGAAKHTTIESWLGDSIDPTPDSKAMIRRYFGAYGPASVRDVQNWSGLTRLRPVIDSMRDELVTFRDESAKELFDLPNAPRPSPDAPAPIRFLAEFDNALLAYADPSRIISVHDRNQVLTINGLVFATVLVDGFVQGSWSIKSEKASATLTIQLFAPVEPSDRIEMINEGASLLTFAAENLEPRVVVVPAA